MCSDIVVEVFNIVPRLFSAHVALLYRMPNMPLIHASPFPFSDLSLYKRRAMPIPLQAMYKVARGSMACLPSPHHKSQRQNSRFGGSSGIIPSNLPV